MGVGGAVKKTERYVPTGCRFVMGKLLLLLLSCIGLRAANVEVEITTITNSPTSTVDVHMSNGQTNLVCDTRLSGGSLYRIVTFFHRGACVGRLTTTPDFQDFLVEGKSPYAVCFRSMAGTKSQFVYVTGTDGRILNVFTGTNGLWAVAESRLISELEAGRREVLRNVGTSVP